MSDMTSTGAICAPRALECTRLLLEAGIRTVASPNEVQSPADPRARQVEACLTVVIDPP